MQIKNKVYFLKAERFEFVGKDGAKIVAYVCRLIMDGVLYKCKLSEEVYNDVKDAHDVNGDAVLELNSSKEVTSLRLISLVW